MLPTYAPTHVLDDLETWFTTDQTTDHQKIDLIVPVVERTWETAQMLHNLTTVLRHDLGSRSNQEAAMNMTMLRRWAYDTYHLMTGDEEEDVKVLPVFHLTVLAAHELCNIANTAYADEELAHIEPDYNRLDYVWNELLGYFLTGFTANFEASHFMALTIHTAIDKSTKNETLSASEQVQIAIHEIKTLQIPEAEAPPVETDDAPPTQEAHSSDKTPNDTTHVLGRISMALEVATRSNEQLQAAVDEARSNNVPWRAIGETLGTSGQAAYAKYSPKGRENNRKSQRRYLDLSLIHI